MTQSTHQIRQSEGGFTLVELAIVMIIIGLLIGGILKGQELITNARVASTVAQIKAIESGISGFRDKYNAIPGDIDAPTTRLPNCTVGQCATPGTGGTLNNGVLEPVDPGLAITFANEVGVSFIQLGATGFVGGVQPSTTVLGAVTSHPVTPLGSAWTIATVAGAATSVVDVTGLPTGIYVLAKGAALAAVAVANDVQIMNPSNAGNIDRKLDDGRPTTGVVRAAGGALGATACASTVAGADIYNESLGGPVCGILARVQ